MIPLLLLLAAQELTLSRFLDDLADLDRLTIVEDAPVRMHSTWDRTGANADGFRPEWVKAGVYTIADLTGPGVVRRFYSARPGGTLRIAVDGATVVEMPCADFFSGTKPPFVKPTVSPLGGGFYSYFPIPYAKSLKITISAAGEGDGAFGGYYQVTYQAFSPRTRVQSLTRRGLEAARGEGAPSTPPPQQAVFNNVVAPGEEATIAALGGAGVVEELRLKIDPPALRSTLLRMRWDDDERDAVDAPIGDFFGNGFSMVPFQTLPLGLDSEGYYSRFRMPFARRASIRILNQGAKPVTVSGRVLWRRRGSLAANVGRFHAKWRREETAAVERHERNIGGADNYSILEAEGRGRFIGATLNVWNRHMLWWGEGDPMIFVDGDTWPPSIHGTGTEEFFNDAWGFHETTEGSRDRAISPVSAVLLAGLSSPGRCFGPNAIVSLHLADSIPFRERIRVTIEHGTENNLTNDYASVAYWYALPGARDFFVMRPAEERTAPPQEEWEPLRQAAIRSATAALRARIREMREEIARHPTDAERHPRRVRIVRQVLQLAPQIGIREADLARVQSMMNDMRRRPIGERGPLLDAIIAALAGM